jgi:hypothetical protein
MAAKKIKETNDEQPIELHCNTDISPVWIDGVNIGIRDDDICFLRLISELPEGACEQYKMMTNKSNLKKIINSLCSALKYYPVPDDKKNNDEA